MAFRSEEQITASDGCHRVEVKIVNLQEPSKGKQTGRCKGLCAKSSQKESARSKSKRVYKVLKKAEIDVTSNISFGFSEGKTILKKNN